MANALIHDAIIDWPNGKGYTPCTAEYWNLHDERESLKPTDDETLDDLSPERYQRYCEIDNELGGLQLNGHLGKSVRY